MPAIDRGLDRLTFLPEALRDALRRRLRELGGLALLLVATLLALALATWSVHDPSLSHATNAPVRNVLGVSGAIVADLLIQLLGVAALALVLPIAIWGWKLATHRPLQRERIRLAFCVLAILLAAACTAALPRTPAWPLPVGLGGVVGDWMLRFPALLAGGTLSGLARAAVAIVTGAGTLVCFAIAAGLGWRAGGRHVDDAVDDERERGSISLGWITHGFLSLKARLARVLKRRPQARSPARRAAAPAQDRTEPRFDESARASLQPQIEPEEDEEDEDEAVPGHIFLLVWMLSLVLLVPQERIWLGAGLCFAAAAGLYPGILPPPPARPHPVTAGYDLVCQPALLRAGDRFCHPWHSLFCCQPGKRLADGSAGGGHPGGSRWVFNLGRDR